MNRPTPSPSENGSNTGRTRKSVPLLGGGVKGGSVHGEFGRYSIFVPLVRSNTVAGAILKRYVYGYDKAGNRTSESLQTSGASSVTSAAHNNVNQLTSTTGGGATRFKGSLNELGTVTVGGSAAPLDSRTTNFVGYATTTTGTNTVAIIATDYSSNKRTNNYQLVVTNAAGAFTLQYDLNGNLTNDGNGLVYEYDAADRTTAIIRNTTNRTEFAYDGLGRRVQVIVQVNGTATSTNKYVWCGTELCEERNNTGATVTKRFFGQGEQIAGVNYFFTRDHLGSVREMTDSTGAVRARYDYDPYGRRTKVAGTLDADFGYTGHFMLANQPDHTLTLYRLYRPDLGRWCSRDPLAEQAGLNLYAYVGNDPLNAFDILGLAAYPADFIGPIQEGDCYSPIPTHPSNADIDKNMKEAYYTFNPNTFRDRVKDGGPWDYKVQGMQYENFGNFHYGATGAAFGFSENTLLRMAGDAQIAAKTTRKGWGDPQMLFGIPNPFKNGIPPYGDDPKDQEWIKRRIEYYKKYGPKTGNKCDCK